MLFFVCVRVLERLLAHFCVQALLAKGFPEWKKPEWQGFVRGMEMYGRDAFADIALEVGRPESEVKQYHAVFWRKYKTLPEWEKVIARVERGDKRREAQKDAIALLKSTFSDFDPIRTNIADLVGSSNSSKASVCVCVFFFFESNSLFFSFPGLDSRERSVAADQRQRRRLRQLGASAAQGRRVSGFCHGLVYAVANVRGSQGRWFCFLSVVRFVVTIGQDRVDKLLKNIMERSKRKSSAAASAAAAPATVAAEKKKPGRKRPVEAAPIQESKAETKEKAVKKRVKKDTGPEKNLSAYK